MTQFIDDGYENKDVTAAYDTINHRLLLVKVAKFSRNSKMVKSIQYFVANRRFFVEMDGKKNRWHTQKKVQYLLQFCSMYLPMKCRSSKTNIRKFLYADDLSLGTQADCFETIESRITPAPFKLTEYYKQNSLNANPGKTQVCAFQLNNHFTSRNLNME